MKAICIKNTDYEGVLTLGKVYEVDNHGYGELGMMLYKFIGDDNKDHTAYEYRFLEIMKKGNENG